MYNIQCTVYSEHVCTCSTCSLYLYVYLLETIADECTLHSAITSIQFIIGAVHLHNVCTCYKPIY